MEKFELPLHFEDLGLSSENRNSVNLRQFESSSWNSILDELIARIEESDQNNDFQRSWWYPLDSTSLSSEQLEDNETSEFSKIYFLVSKFGTQSKANQKKMIQTLCTSIEHMLQYVTAVEMQTMSIKNECLKIGVFIAAGLATEAEKISRDSIQPGVADEMSAKAGEKSKKKTELNWSWEKNGRERMLSSLLKCLQCAEVGKESERSGNLDELAHLCNRAAYSMMESPQFSKDKASKSFVFQILGLSVVQLKQDLEVITPLLHLIDRHEHCPSIVADLLITIVEEYEHPSIIRETLKEISELNLNELCRDSASARNTALFLMDLSDKCPGLITPSLPSLLIYFNTESYIMRNALIHIFGRLVKYELSEDSNDGKQSKRFKDGDRQLRYDNALDHVDVILSRCRDVNAFTRSKALQTLGFLCENRILPLTRLSDATKAAISRMEDRTAVVRRSAIHLLSTILRTNPFGPVLRRLHFTTRLSELEAQHTNESDAAIDEESDEQDGSNEEVSSKHRALGFYRKAVEFLELLESCMPTLYLLLRSSSITDTVEAVELFIVALKFQVDGAFGSVRKILPLIFSREKSVQDACLSGYQQLIFPPSMNVSLPQDGTIVSEHTKDEALAIARGLLSLLKGCTIGERTCLAELVKKLGIASETIIQVLCDIISGRVPGMNTEVFMNGACDLLGMISTASQTSVQSRLSVFQSRLEICAQSHDFKGTRAVCIALQSIYRASTIQLELSGQENSIAGTLDASDGLIRTLVEVLVDWESDRNQENPNTTSNNIHTLVATSEQCVNVIYTLCSQPEIAMSEVIQRLALRLNLTSDGSIDSEECVSKVNEVSCSEVSRFIFLIGHVAMKQLVHSERVLSVVRAKNSTVPVEKQGGKNQTLTSKDGHDGEEEEDGLSVHFGPTSGTDDREFDAAMSRVEQELVASGSFLGRFIPLVVQCARDQNAPNAVLRTCAVISLCKLMAVDGNFCSSNLQLLFSILKNAKESVVRANVIIALGDLSFRFPNLVEPWSSRIYLSLDDHDPTVRRNALMALSHLILNDMVKIKGQVVTLALRLNDSDPGIVEQVRVFFQELARKGNNLVYNVLPDILSCLSTRNDVNSVQFRSVMRYLLSFINKERQIEGTIEKLCQRFRTSRATEEWRNIAHCLSLLSYNSERSITKLLNMFSSYAEKLLIDEEVLSTFCGIVNKAKKFAKPEVRAKVDELEARLERIQSAAHNASKANVDQDGNPCATPSQFDVNSNIDAMMDAIADDVDAMSLFDSTAASRSALKSASRKSLRTPKKSTTKSTTKENRAVTPNVNSTVGRSKSSKARNGVKNEQKKSRAQRKDMDSADDDSEMELSGTKLNNVKADGAPRSRSTRQVATVRRRVVDDYSDADDE